MKKLLTLTLVVAITVCVTVFLYLRFRYPDLEKRQTRHYEIQAERTYAAYSNWFSDDSVDVDGLTLLLNKMLEKDSRLDLAFCMDNYSNLITRNYRTRERNKQYYSGIIDSLRESFRDSGKEPAELFYMYNQKYFVSYTETEKCILVMVYPFSLSRTITVKLVLECVAAVAFAVMMVLGLLSCIFRTKVSLSSGTNREAETAGHPNSSQLYTVSPQTQESCHEEKHDDEPAESTDNKTMLEPFEEDTDVVHIENRKSAQAKIRSFESYIFNLFYKLSITYQIRSLSLYLYDSDADDLKKIYELFGSAFVKTPPHNSLETENNPEIIKALLEDSVIVRQNSTKIFIPIFSDTSFSGMLVIKNNAPIAGDVYSAIKSRSQEIGRYLMQEIHKKAV